MTIYFPSYEDAALWLVEATGNTNAMAGIDARDYNDIVNIPGFQHLMSTLMQRQLIACACTPFDWKPNIATLVALIQAYGENI